MPHGMFKVTQLQPRLHLRSLWLQRGYCLRLGAVTPVPWAGRPVGHLFPLSHVQCAGTLPGGTEEEKAACHQEDQHLPRDLPCVLRTLRDHQVSLPGAGWVWGFGV